MQEEQNASADVSRVNQPFESEHPAPPAPHSPRTSSSAPRPLLPAPFHSASADRLSTVVPTFTFTPPPPTRRAPSFTSPTKKASPRRNPAPPLRPVESPDVHAPSSARTSTLGQVGTSVCLS